MRSPVVLLLIASLSLCARAQNDAQNSNSAPPTTLTVHAASEGLPAAVHLRRTLELGAGENRVEFPASPAIDPASVLLRGDGLWLAESALLLPPATPEQILRSYLGRDVLVNRKQGGDGERARQPETLSGKLLAFDKDSLVLATSNRQIPVQILPRTSDIMEIKLLGRDETPPPTRAALSCLLVASTAGPREVELSYRTAGLAWSADYAVTLGPAPDAPAQLAGWATLANETGVAFGPARVFLATRPRRPASADGARNRALSYPLPRPVELAPGDRRRVSLFEPKTRLPARPAAVFFSADRDPAFAAASTENLFRSGEGAEPVDEVLLLGPDNDRDAPPLPEGKVRVVRAGAADDAPPDLVAEGTVGRTPPGQPMMVRLGRADGLSATRKRTLTTSDPDKPTDGPAPTPQRVERVDLTLSNHTAAAQRVLVVERLKHPGAKLTVEGGTPELRDRNTAVIPIDVPARGAQAVRILLQYDE